MHVGLVASLFYIFSSKVRENREDFRLCRNVYFVDIFFLHWTLRTSVLCYKFNNVLLMYEHDEMSFLLLSLQVLEGDDEM